MLRPFNRLTDDEVTAFVAESVQIIGIERASKSSWQRRAARDGDGAWRVGVTTPLQDALLDRDRPWKGHPWEHHPKGRVIVNSEMPGLAREMRYHPIAKAADLLFGDSNPEVEVERRQKLFDTYWQQEDAKHEREAQAARDHVRFVKEHKAARPERWAKLPLLQRQVLLAAAGSDGKSGKQALAELARVLGLPESARELRDPPRTFEPENL